MPPHPDTPQPLKMAMEQMEAQVQSVKRSLAFAAPEMQDTFWIKLQHDLADTLATMYTILTGEGED